MRDKRVLFYGGPELEDPLSKFVELLAYRLLKANDRIRIVTGGFRKYKNPKKPDTFSTDISAANGARRFAKEKGEPLDSVLKTMLPDPPHDERAPKVERFSGPEGGKVEILTGFSDKARRLKLVQVADMVITTAGAVHTALVLEMAIATGRPALPLAFTGGDSKKYWSGYHSYFLERLGLSPAQANEIQNLKIPGAARARIEGCIGAITEAVNRIVQDRKCLVLMRFDPEFDSFYSRLKQAIEANGYFAIRLDHQIYPGDVRDTVQKLTRECGAIIADITDRSINVIYEVALAHAFGRAPLLLLRGTPQEAADLPFYLRSDRVLALGDGADLAKALEPYLQDPLKTGRL